MSENLFTIGYAAFDHYEKFLDSLKDFKIEVVIDVRSKPYSSRFIEYDAPSLKVNLKDAGIKYVHIPELGAYTDDESLMVNGLPDWELMAGSKTFRKGIERVRKGMEVYRCCLMCAEKEPQNCHRAIMIGRYLRRSVPMLHIEAQGGLVDTVVVELRLLEMYGMDQQENLFKSREDAITEAYKRQTDKLIKRWARRNGVKNERKAEMPGMQNKHAACQ